MDSTSSTNRNGGVSQTYLPLDPDFLLGYMAGLPDEANDDFDGCLSDSNETPCNDEGAAYVPISSYKLILVNNIIQ